jgi:murein DD-endopeptidase MepM/ murein hydrolase activator NlpD
MARRSDIDAFVVGVLILLAMSNSTTDRWPTPDELKSRNLPPEDPRLWHWPVPDLVFQGTRYQAAISQEFKPATHRGLDMMYHRRGRGAPDATAFPTGLTDAQGARQHVNFFAPIGTPILAARDGTVWSVQEMPGRGLFVVIDHGKPWATLYGHLKTVDIASTRGTPVRRGQQIGTMGFAPADGEKLRHLHFEAWFEGGSFRAGRDAGAVMESWERGQWTL